MRIEIESLLISNLSLYSETKWERERNVTTHITTVTMFCGNRINNGPLATIAGRTDEEMAAVQGNDNYDVNN